MEHGWRKLIPKRRGFTWSCADACRGLAFAGSLEKSARGLDLAGWVKNRPDGGVEVVAEGSEASVRLLIKQLRVGPPGADVGEVQEFPIDRSEVPKPFGIAR